MQKELIKEKLHSYLDIDKTKEWNYSLITSCSDKTKYITCIIDHVDLTIKIYVNDSILQKYKDKSLKWLKCLLWHHKVAHIYKEGLRCIPL